MRDFVEFCLANDLVNVANDGTVTWKEGTSAHKEKLGGSRDQRKDISGDYKGHFHSMDTVWPFKVVAKGGKKQAAPVAK